MSVTKREKMDFLKKELKEYEKETPMTEKERKLLHEWVNEGHSVHANESYAVYEGGIPIDFLDVYREEEEIRQKLDSLSGEERERYLCDLRGEPYLPDLLAEIYAMRNKLAAYKRTLEDHGLLKTAEDYYTEMYHPIHKNKTDENEELPFS